MRRLLVLAAARISDRGSSPRGPRLAGCAHLLALSRVMSQLPLRWILMPLGCGTFGGVTAQNEKCFGRLSRFVAEQVGCWRNPIRPGTPAGIIGDHDCYFAKQQRELHHVDEQIARLS